jgi:hypothetical protein
MISYKLPKSKYGRSVVGNVVELHNRASSGPVGKTLRRGLVLLKKFSQDLKRADEGDLAAEGNVVASKVAAARAAAHFVVYRGSSALFYGLVEPFWSQQFLKAYRFVTFGRTFMHSNDIQMARAHLRTGDMIAGRCEAAATTNAIEWLGSRWTHVGLYVGDGLVVEALDSSGVVVTQLSLFMRRYTRVAIYRSEEEWDVERGVKYALAQVGKAYNFAFLFNERAFYCTQLVWNAMIEGGLSFANPRKNRMGYPVISPDHLIYDNRERLQLVWSAGHEIFRDQAEAVVGISRMTAQLVISVLAERGGAIPGLTPDAVEPENASDEVSRAA